MERRERRSRKAPTSLMMWGMVLTVGGVCGFAFWSWAVHYFSSVKTDCVESPDCVVTPASFVLFLIQLGVVFWIISCIVMVTGAILLALDWMNGEEE